MIKSSLCTAGAICFYIGVSIAALAAEPPQQVTPEMARQALGRLFAPFPPESQVPTGFQRHEPVKSVNPRDPSIPRVALSKTEKLKLGHEVEVPEWPDYPGAYYIQRLTDNTWWVYADLYAMTLYVGEKEALIIDMPEFIVMDELAENVEDILKGRPITTLVYSHPHPDHVGKADEFVAYQANKGIEVRVIGSTATAREIRDYRMPIPLPTETLLVGRQTFQFDGKPFIYNTPTTWAHTGADAYTITPDGVAHVVDMFYGNRLPLHDYSGVQNMKGWIIFLRHLAGEQWKFANIGHVNVASRPGIMRSLQYTKDLYDAWFEVAPKYWNRDFFPHAEVGESYVATFLRNLFDKISFEVALKLKPKYGHLPHWTLSHDHAMKVQWDLFLNYSFLDRPDIRPDFTPIKPSKVNH